MRERLRQREQALRSQKRLIVSIIPRRFKPPRPRHDPWRGPPSRQVWEGGWGRVVIGSWGHLSLRGTTAACSLPYPALACGEKVLAAREGKIGAPGFEIQLPSYARTFYQRASIGQSVRKIADLVG